MKGKFTYEYLTLKKEKKMEARKIPPTFSVFFMSMLTEELI